MTQQNFLKWKHNSVNLVPRMQMMQLFVSVNIMGNDVLCKLCERLIIPHIKGELDKPVVRLVQ